MSKEFKKIASQFSTQSFKSITDIPPIPITAFKKYDLLSIKNSKIFKTLRSSGTSGKSTSKIFLDSENSKNQTWVLSKIMEYIFGKKRLPMLIIEKEPNYKILNRSDFNARIAAINGFSIFSNKRYFVFDQNYKINDYKLLKFLKENFKKKFIIFGFTDQIYKFFFKNNLNKQYIKYFKNGILLHGGGDWTKLESKKIDNSKFKKYIKLNFKIKNIYNYYGLIEQTGSIFIECPECSAFNVQFILML